MIDRTKVNSSADGKLAIYSAAANPHSLCALGTGNERLAPRIAYKGPIRGPLARTAQPRLVGNRKPHRPVTFIRWARLGVWERLLRLAQDAGVQLGMTFLDGTSIRAHQNAAGARRKGAHKLSGTGVRRWAARAAALAARPA